PDSDSFCAADVCARRFSLEACFRTTDGLSLNPDELLDRHLWISVLGVEGELLSRRFAYGEDAAVLRRAIRHNRNQLHLSPHSRAEDDRKLESANAGEISVCTEGAAENHPLVEAARLLRHTGVFFENRGRSRRTIGPG